MSVEITCDNCLAHAEGLVEALKSGDSETAANIIDKLTDLRESSMFQEVGKLTRQLHDTLNSFNMDARITEMVDDMPDAKERLGYVVQKTEASAHKTMDLVEHSLPLCDDLKYKADTINQSWSRFVSKNMDVEEFRSLVKETQDFMAKVESVQQDLRDNLNEVLMAQDYQDITGQIIKRVINLVQNVEDGLVQIIKISGGSVSSGSGASSEEDLAGPQVPGMESETAVSGQDEVDELLASLGF